MLGAPGVRFGVISDGWDARTRRADFRSAPEADLQRAGSASRISGYGRDSLPRAFRDVALLSKPFSQSQLLDAAMQSVTRSAGGIPLRKR